MNRTIGEIVGRLAVIVTTLNCLLPNLANAVDVATCNGKFNGQKLTEEELLRELQQSDRPNDLNLCGVLLSRSNLSGAPLFFTRFSKADFLESNLSKAYLDEADFRGARLTFANLSEASLSRTDLSGAILSMANLSRAGLYKANLTNTGLKGANLSGAALVETNLTGVYLEGAIMSGVIFEPSELPSVDSIAGASRLSEMTFHNSPRALVKLRNSFRETGYRQQEREVTYAIRHTSVRKDPDASLGGQIDRLFQYVFFELTSLWGMSPGRALWILVGFIPVFAIPYMFALRAPGRDGIWRQWNEKRIRQDLGSSAPEKLRCGWWAAAILGFYFSVLSAFHIGWRDLNLGSWILRLQPKEYSLGASGWVRTVSGFQSLLSVYLLAIWAITYFGRPFE